MTGDYPGLFDALDLEPTLKPEPCLRTDDHEPTVLKGAGAPQVTRKRRTQESSAGASTDQSLEHYLTERDLTQRYKVSRQTLWRWVKAGSFPAPVMLGKKTKRWPLSVIKEHDRQLVKASLRGLGKTKSRRVGS